MFAPLNLLQSTSRFTTILALHNTTTASANLSDDGEMKVLMTFPAENKMDPHQIFRLLIIYDLNIAPIPLSMLFNPLQISTVSSFAQHGRVLAFDETQTNPHT